MLPNIGDTYIFNDNELLYVTLVTDEYVHTQVLSMPRNNLEPKPGVKRYFTLVTFKNLALHKLTFTDNFKTQEELLDHIHDLRVALRYIGD